MNYKIPVYKPSLMGKEKKYVIDCMESTWISSKGEYIKKFEDGFSRFLDIEYSTSVCNGTVALHLALLTLGLGNNDEIIVPTFTYIASVNAIQYTGATPVFVDSLESTWQMDPNDIRNKISEKTRAILVVHLYGHPCEMEEICMIAKEYNLFVIEDCAEAFGSKYKGKFVGTFGDVAAFSFFGNKTITTGEGGMIITNDNTLYDRALHIKGQGLAKYREYWHDIIGYNYRMTNICAAIGLAQLERAEDIIEQKRKIAEWYNTYLAQCPVIPHKEVGEVFHTYWMYSILVPHVNDRDRLRQFLAQNGIETRPTFYPVHTMPMYSHKYQRHIVAENLGWRGMNLPSYPDLHQEEVKMIADIINTYFERNEK